MSATFDPSKAVAAYTRAFQHLRTLPGFSLQQLLRAEAAVILKTWAGKVKVAKPQEIDDRARYSALVHLGATTASKPGDVSINVGKRGSEAGLVWQRTKGERGNGRPYVLAGRMAKDGRFIANWRHFTSRQWADVMDTVIDAELAINKEIKLGRKSIGLARQSVIQIADDLGINLEAVRGGQLSSAAIAKARAAMTRSGKAVKNGRGTQGGDDTKYFVELMDSLPYGRAIGIDRELAGVLARRGKAMTIAFQKGAGDSIAKAKKSFPEVFRQSG